MVSVHTLQDEGHTGRGKGSEWFDLSDLLLKNGGEKFGTKVCGKEVEQLLLIEDPLPVATWLGSDVLYGLRVEVSSHAIHTLCSDLEL